MVFMTGHENRFQFNEGETMKILTDEEKDRIGKQTCDRIRAQIYMLEKGLLQLNDHEQEEAFNLLKAQLELGMEKFKADLIAAEDFSKVEEITSKLEKTLAIASSLNEWLPEPIDPEEWQESLDYWMGRGGWEPLCEYDLDESPF
jgi:hypothetical protein